MELENILSEVTQTQKDTHGLSSQVDSDHKVPTLINIPKEAEWQAGPKGGCGNLLAN